MSEPTIAITKKSGRIAHIDQRTYEGITDARGLLRWVLPQMSARRRRLFAVAAVRQALPHALNHTDALRQLLATEEVCDTPRGERALPAKLEALGEYQFSFLSNPTKAFLQALLRACLKTPQPNIGLGKGKLDFMLYSLHHLAKLTAEPSTKLRAMRKHDRQTADLLRDIAGFPPSRVYEVHEGITAEAARLARGAYDLDRHKVTGRLNEEHLTVLADCLEEGGCPMEVVDHLRTPGPHVRGCWALDIALGKT